jgi:hypothetical protein
MATTPAGTPPDLSLQHLADVSLRLLPWLLPAMSIALAIAGPGGYQILLNLGASPFYGAAAARALGLHPGRSVPALAVDRAFSHLTAVLPLVVLAALAAAVGSTLAAMAAEAAGIRRALPANLGAALAALPVLWRYWPAALLAYLVPDEAGYRVAHGRGWRGPRLTDARTLVRTAGDGRRSALVLACLTLWIALLLATGRPAAPHALHVVAHIASYLLLLPVLVTLTAIEVLRMLHPPLRRPPLRS